MKTPAPKTAMPWALFLGAFLWVLLPGLPVFCAESLRLGVLVPLTGELSEAGRTAHRAFTLAAHEINAQGGIRGRQIELVAGDSAGDPGRAKAAVERLTGEQHVVALSGGISSTAALAAAAAAEKRKVPFLVSTAAANEITEKGWRHVFRLCSPSSEHPKTLASFLQRAARVRNAAVLCEDSPFGRYGLMKFSARCRAMGVEIVLIGRHAPGAADFTSFLEKTRARHPQMVSMISHPADAAAFLMQSRTAQVHPELYFGRGPGFDLQAFRETAGALSDHVFTTTLWAPSVPYPGARNFYEAYAARFGLPPDYHGAQAYAAMQVLRAALKATRSFTPEDIRGSLAATETLTVFGPVRFGSHGKMARQNQVPVLLVQWIEGNLETVWPKEAASARYVFPFPGWTMD